MSSVRRSILRGMEKKSITRINENGNRRSRRSKKRKQTKND